MRYLKFAGVIFQDIGSMTYADLDGRNFLFLDPSSETQCPEINDSWIGTATEEKLLQIFLRRYLDGNQGPSLNKEVALMELVGRCIDDELKSGEEPQNHKTRGQQ